MAKYEVEHSCGHVVVHQLYGKIRDRERKIEWLEDNLCSECWQKQLEEERQAKNAEAAEKNLKEGLPPLDGTEKQVAWAESIRGEMVPRLSRIGSKLIEAVKLFGTADEDTRKKTLDRIIDLGFSSVDEYLNKCLQAIDNIQAQKAASWWIDNRDVVRWQGLIEKEAVTIASEQIENSDTAENAKTEATLSPPEPISNTPAEISLVDGVVSIKYPVKNRDFWEIVKPKLGYSWNGKHWEKEIGVVDGYPIDRLAEAGHLLLAAGFPVIIWDDDAREKAATGEYEPQHSRWITKSIKSGNFLIQWDRKEEDFYKEARLITGSGWSSPYVTVPPGEYKEILDFAEQFDFHLSPGAQELIAEQEAILAGAKIVDPAPIKKQDHIDTSRPELDPSTVTGEADADLVDD